MGAQHQQPRGADRNPGDQQEADARREAPPVAHRAARRRPGVRARQRCRPGQQGRGEDRRDEDRGQVPGPVDGGRREPDDEQGQRRRRLEHRVRTPGAADAGDHGGAEEGHQEGEADDPELRQGLEQQRVRSLGRDRDVAMLEPVGRVAARAHAADGRALERVHRGLPELVAAAAAPAEQAHVAAGQLLAGGRRLELVELLDRVDRDHRHDRGDDHPADRDAPDVAGDLEPLQALIEGEADDDGHGRHRERDREHRRPLVPRPPAGC